jgi:acyl-CoA reductase-like NAD-dependent aldehyde dehydrogenase
MDIPGCASIINYYAGAAYHVLGESSFNTADFLNISMRLPYGVVGLIIPWNVRIFSPFSFLFLFFFSNDERKNKVQQICTVRFP